MAGKEAKMRRTAFWLVAMAAVTLVAGGIALAAVAGTARAEVFVGTRYSDDIRAGGGDEVHGLRGPDRLEGGRGEDLVRGGRGDDFTGSADARDGDDGLRDVVRCGPGHDTVDVDRSDRVASGCEDVSVPSRGLPEPTPRTGFAVGLHRAGQGGAPHEGRHRDPRTAFQKPAP